MTANASDYSATQAVTKDYSIAGVLGSDTVIDKPYISSTSLSDHRDYMVYVNLYSGQSMGAGHYAYKDSSGTVYVYTLEYWYDASGAAHNLVNTIPTSSSYTVKVEQQTSSSSNCWRATTYGGEAITKCFSATTYPAAESGAVARTLAPHSYSSGTEDLPGLFDYLQAGKWQSGSVVYGDYFSSSHTTWYKCWAGNGYVMKYLGSYTGGSTEDKIGTGPRDYSSPSDCTYQDPAWDANGE
jgi:hypothetical protein